MTAPTRRAPALLRSIGEHFAKLSQRLHVEPARNDEAASSYAERTLAAAGFTIAEEPFTRFAHRNYGRFRLTGAWVIGAAAVYAATRLVGLKWEWPLYAVAAFTFLFDQWLQLRRIPVESSNIIATRGKPRAWLVASLDAEAERLRSTEVEYTLVVTAGLTAWVLLPANPVINLIGYVFAATWITGLLIRPLFKISRPAVAPISGAAAVLAAIEAIGRDEQVGVLLTRGQDAERSGFTAGLAFRTNAPTILVGSVGGPERLVMIKTESSSAALAVPLQRAAAAEQLPLKIEKATQSKRGWWLPAQSVGRVDVELKRPTFPGNLNHIGVLFFQRERYRARFDPIGQIAAVGRLLVRLIEDKPEEVK